MAKAEPKRISQLDASSPLTGAEQIALVQNTKTVKTTLATVKDYTDTSCQCTLFSRYDSIPTATSLSYYFNTYTVPGGTLNNDGDWLHVWVNGTFAANANLKTAGMSISQGAFNQAITITAGNYNNQSWGTEFRIQRTSLTTFKVIGTFHVDTISDIFVQSFSGVNFSADILLSAYGYSLTAAGDVTLESWIGQVNKLDPNS